MAERRQIHVGNLPIGGGAPVVVQSMTTTKTGDAAATLDQVQRLAAAGCELARVTLPEASDLDAFAEVVERSPLPVIADIHFDWRLAIAALERGAACVRINPGTIGAEEHVRAIVDEAARRGAALRIGANSGSLPRDLRVRYDAALARRDESARAQRAAADSADSDAAARATAQRNAATGDAAEALVEAALRDAAKLEAWGFGEYKLSVKSSSVPQTIAAYRLLAQRSEAPLHVGVTEAGTAWGGTIKSAAGIGALLADGIGDTIRVSLTGDPVEEVRVAWTLLAALELRHKGPNLVSCPTCGRTELDIVGLAAEVERRLEAYSTPISVAVMGCRVNGPQEARHADFGIAGGSGEGVVFAHGEKVATVPEGELVGRLFELIDAGIAES